MHYKEENDHLFEVSKNIDGQDGNDRDIEKIVIETFDSLLPQLYDSYQKGDIDEFYDKAIIIFYQLSGKYPTLFKHAIETQFINFLLEALQTSVEYLSKPENHGKSALPFTETVLQLIVGLCNSPTPVISQYLLDNSDFMNNLNFYIYLGYNELSSLALTILGSILYDAKNLLLNDIDSLLPDQNAVLQIMQDNPDSKDVIFRICAYMINLYHETNKKAEFIHELIKYITPSCKIGVLLDSFRNALLSAESPNEFAEAFAVDDFLEGGLADIAVPYSDEMETNIPLWELQQTNSCFALKLILAIYNLIPDLGEHLLQQLSFDRLVYIKSKDNDLIAVTYEIIAIAIPNRRWICQLLIDNRVLFTLKDVLDTAVYNLRYAAMKMLNNLIKYSSSSLLAGLFIDIFNQEFIETLVDFLQLGQLDLTSIVLEIFLNLLKVAKTINLPSFFQLVNTEEFNECLESLENDDESTIDREWLGQIITEIHELVEISQQERNDM